jgi:hypothetical protein
MKISTTLVPFNSTSGKHIHPGFCLNLDLAATTLSCQQAQVVSKKAVSGFKLAKIQFWLKQHCVVI